MSNKSLILGAMALVSVLACSKIESYSDNPVDVNMADEPEYISLRLVNEGEDATKAYYYEEPSYWTYVWEDKDYFAYFYYDRKTLMGNRTTQVTKTPELTAIRYQASDLQVGNKIYSYFVQKDLLGNVQNNNDPTAIKMIIPTSQYTTNTPEKYTTSIDATVHVGDYVLDKYKDTGTGGVTETATIPSRLLTFKITDFKPNMTYTCELVGGRGGFSNFTYDENGNASVNVSFHNYDEQMTEETTEIRISSNYAGKYTGNFWTIDIIARREYSTHIDALWKNKVSSYEVTDGGYGTKPVTNTRYGETRPYPLRDCMPCASRAKIITSSLLEYPEDIANSMTMYMLGSAAEFRIYSSNSNYVGEDIVKCVFKAETPCAGECYYNLESEDLQLTGFTEKTIESDVTESKYKIPAVKGGEDSVYMIIAPGTYDFRFSVITKDNKGELWETYFYLTNKEFTRASIKPFAVNLNASSATRVKYVEDTGNTDAGGEGGNEDDEEGM